MRKSKKTEDLEDSSKLKRLNLNLGRINSIYIRFFLYTVVEEILILKSMTISIPLV